MPTILYCPHCEEIFIKHHNYSNGIDHKIIIQRKTTTKCMYFYYKYKCTLLSSARYIFISFHYPHYNIIVVSN